MCAYKNIYANLYQNCTKKCITKIRLSSYKLAIEQGRYNKINRKRRTYKLCINEIEDEMYFILCPIIICKTVLLKKAVCL